MTAGATTSPSNLGAHLFCSPSLIRAKPEEVGCQLDFLRASEDHSPEQAMVKTLDKRSFLDCAGLMVASRAEGYPPTSAGAFSRLFFSSTEDMARQGSGKWGCRSRRSARRRSKGFESTSTGVHVTEQMNVPCTKEEAAPVRPVSSRPHGVCTEIKPHVGAGGPTRPGEACEAAGARPPST